MSGPNPAHLESMGKMTNFGPCCQNALRSSSMNGIVQGIDSPPSESTLGDKTDSGQQKEDQIGGSDGIFQRSNPFGPPLQIKHA